LEPLAQWRSLQDYDGLSFSGAFVAPAEESVVARI
jgi:hypothetical protein